MKLELESLGSLENQTSAIQVLNDNFGRISEALENTLSRDGLTPNFMDSPLDMNSERIVNLPAPSSASEPARFVDVTNALALDGLVGIPTLAGNSNKLLGTDGTLLVWKTPVEYPGIGDLKASNNLSEVTPATARTNLGLGTAAVKNVGSSGDSVPVTNGVATWSSLQTFTGGFVLSGPADFRNSSVSTSLSVDSVGYRGAPTVVQDAGYTFVLNDSGQSKLHTSASAHNYTIPSGVFPVGTTILVANIGAGAVTLVRGSGVTLRQAGVGTDKNLVVAQWGLCTLYQYGTNSWLAGGSGVS
jgi:hypothetical protein